MNFTMRTLVLISTLASVVHAQTTSIGGAAGNGNFELITSGDPATGVNYSLVPNWHWANGNDVSQKFVFNTVMGGATDSSSNGGYLYQNRLVVNDAGYTIAAAGEVFSLSYNFGAGGSAAGWAEGDEFVRAYLFTATAPVDAALGTANMSALSGFDDYLMNRPANGQWTSHVNENFYTATTTDVGKTVYLALQLNNPAGPTGNPRIDIVQLDVTGGTTNPPVVTLPTGWADFVTAYGLSGYYEIDSDNDGVSDRIEFAHGGNPTNPAETGIAPALVFSNRAACLVSLESAGTNAGITYTAEWIDNLVSGVWQTAWMATNSASSTLPDYDEVEYQVDGTSHDNLFFRNRLSPSTFRPNILFILADDLGYADVSFNVDAPAVADITTPQLDSLADTGTRFTSAYVVHPFCGPSRMGLWAGRYPHEFGGPFNLPIINSGAYTDQGITTNETLISSVLQDADYQTGIIGKWHLGEEPEHHPNNRGFDEFYGFLGGGKNYQGPYQEQTGSVYDYKTYWESNGVAVAEASVLSGYLTDTLSGEGVRFIKDAAATSDPFFLFMSYNAPHTPLYSDSARTLPFALQSDMDVFPGLSGDRLAYAGLVYGMDRGVGELVQALKDTGQYENTLIVFLSDNGGKTSQGAVNAPLRGTKGDTREGGFRVPMFMHWPSVIPAGVDYDHPVTALDFYPTFARLAGADLPDGKDLDGKEIWDDILGNQTPRAGEPIYTVRYQIGQDTTFVGIRQDNWKALKEWPANSNWKLYDIDNDMGETNDVSAAYPAVLSNMVYHGQMWATNHVTPDWYDSTGAEMDWIRQNMPHYDLVFTNSLP